ncbi:FadR/GntR family transcriptional regulator [Thalassobacillus devorans]|uniref:FadR/GntR family transcriptional regulator n=1 Tax=Thalassobacillus devorans TaxID=279813 RepID=UPI00048B28CA|nr:GntR family transcriptional regulator [Thalassobacillus devorans]
MSGTQTVKVYEEVLHQIKMYIEQHQLGPGDKLPSERELSELLNVGRSSIREAFRALELLGLIETRRGEGTFMRTYRPYHMVELLSTFILHEARTKEELAAAKMMLEIEVIHHVMTAVESSHIEVLHKILSDNQQSGAKLHHAFFQYLFEVSGNELLNRMWQLIDGFANTVHDFDFQPSFYHDVIEGMEKKNIDELRSWYEKGINLSKES